MDVIERAPLRVKLALLVSLPLLVSAWMTVSQVRDDLRTRDRLSELEQLAVLVASTHDVVHELQRERGLSASFVEAGAEGALPPLDAVADPSRGTPAPAPSQAQLLTQYARTDERLRALQELAASDLDPGLRERLAPSLGLLGEVPERLAGLRRSTPDPAARLGQFESYTAIIRGLYEITVELEHTGSPTLAGEAIAFAKFVRLTEAVAQERGLLGILLATQRSPDVTQEVLIAARTAIASQELLAEEYLRWAGPEQREAWQAYVNHPVSMQTSAMRLAVLSRSPARPRYAPPVPVDTTSWFDAMSGKLDLLHRAEAELTGDLLETAAALRARETSELWLATGASLLLLAGCVSGGYVVARSVSRPVGRLAEAATRLARGDLSAAPRVLSTDSLGDLAAAFASMIERQRELTHTANEIAADHLDVEVALRSEQDDFGRALRRMVYKLRAARRELERAAREARDLAVREQAAGEAARRAAREDGLTKCLNRTSFLAELERALALAGEAGRERHLLFVDLDGFKGINDSYGHSEGDTVIQLVADRIRACIDPEDVVGRIGGDEFAVLLRDGADAVRARSVAAWLVQALEAPYTIDGATLFLGASVGLSVYPADATDGESLLRCADAAMYEAKKTGGRAWASHTPQMAQRMELRARLERSLRSAMEHEALDVHFQPLVQLSTGRVVGAEALLRFPGEPTRVDDLIEVAERTGLIVPVGEWVMERALRSALEWGGTHAPIEVCVNVSPVQLRRPDFPRVVARLLDELAFPAERLVLEVTESAFIQDLDAAARQMREIRDLGVRFAIDDFGTGHASLDYLRSLPVDILKIDRRFVAGLPGERSSVAVARAAAALAHELGYVVIAEGVESADQAEALRLLGYDFAQGFLFGRAGPAGEWMDVAGRAEGALVPAPAAERAA